MSFFGTLGKIAKGAAGIATLGASDKVLGGDNSQPGDAYKGLPDLNQFGNDPNSSALRDMIAKMPQFSPLTAPTLNAPTADYTGGSYKAKDMSNAALPAFDFMRSRLNSQYSQNQSQAQDALDRQFAASGGGPGNGAQAKQTENLYAATARQKGQDLEGISAQEAQARDELQQMEAQREYQSGEAARGYGFQAQQGNLARQFAANQFNAQNAFDASKFNQQMDFSRNQFMFDSNSKIAALDSAWKQAQAEARNNEFNKEMAQYQAKHSGGILGAGGIMGSGIGT